MQLHRPGEVFIIGVGFAGGFSQVRVVFVVTVDDLHTQMKGRVWSADKAQALIDEAPDAYKNIHDVMEWQADLCKVETELTAIVNYKGT